MSRDSILNRPSTLMGGISHKTVKMKKPTMRWVFGMLDLPPHGFLWQESSAFPAISGGLHPLIEDSFNPKVAFNESQVDCANFCWLNK